MNYKVMQALYGGGSTNQMRGRDSRGRFMDAYGVDTMDNAMIGFGAQDTYGRGRDDGMGGNSQDTYGRGTMRMIAGGPQAHKQMENGVADIEEYIEKPITIGESMKWAENLPEGPKWKPEEVKQYAQKAGIATSGKEFAEFYAVMNAMHSDYHKVLSKHGVTDPAVYAELACAFINDEDAVENKSAVYYRFIVDEG